MPRRRRLALVSLGLLAVGAAVAWLWVARAGGFESLGSLRRAHPLGLALIAGALAACLGLRFLRWQYLMRRVHVRLPARRSLSIFLASLVGIATPAHVGEVVRGLRTTRLPSASRRHRGRARG